jgi:hypothetical protein
VDDRFEECQQVGAPPWNGDLAGLAEHVDTIGAAPNGFHDGDWVAGLTQHLARKGQRHDEGTL